MKPLICKEDAPTLALALVAMAVIMASLLMVAVVRGATSPVGTYTCHGTQPNGKPYALPLSVSARGDTYSLEWGGTPPSAVGIGILHGDRLAVALVSQGGFAVALYTVSPGRLEGSWAGGDGQVFAETCTPSQGGV